MEVQTGTYVFEQGWQKEHQRLAGMEELWDPGTKETLESVGVAPGWRCLEVGAGAGSIAAWLADRVGPAGEVVATDVNTQHLNGNHKQNLEVRRHDILSDPPLKGRFDLVHARLVVEHLGRRALRRMVQPLRAGGWLVIESFDWSEPVIEPDDPLARRATVELLHLMSHSGFDPIYGRKLVHELAAAGLEDVTADGRVRVYRGGSRDSDFARLSLEAKGEALVEARRLTRHELKLALARLDDPGTVFVSGTMISARGRRRG